MSDGGNNGIDVWRVTRRAGAAPQPPHRAGPFRNPDARIARMMSGWFLISRGGLGPDLSWRLRMLSVPGAELVLPVVAPQPVLSVGNKLGSWLT